MSSVRVNADTLWGRAEQLYGKARDVGEMMEGLGSLSTTMQTEWAGDESDSFAQWYYETFRPNLVDGQIAIGKFARAVGECADELLETQEKS